MLYPKVTPVTRKLYPVGLVLAITVVLGSAAPIGAQATDADNLADEIVLTEITPDPAPAGAAIAPPAQASTGPMTVSVLDVIGKLALLVLGVYGITWGLRFVQRNGIRTGREPDAAPESRLRPCGSLKLAGGTTLHMVQVDEQAILVATSSGGDASLMLNLNVNSEDTHQDAKAASGTPSRPDRDSSRSQTASGMRQDGDWEHRRESLIRALAQRAS